MKLGFVDLALVAIVVLSVGTRTPVGGVARYGWAWYQGDTSALPSLTAYFGHGAAPVPDVEDLPERPVITPRTPEDTGFPEPWRTAASRVLKKNKTKVLREALATQDHLPKDDQLTALLDARYTGDVEETLELLAIGADLRDRAIARARAAGTAEPQRFANHRAYLPNKAAEDADKLVEGTQALATALDIGWPLQGKHRVSSPYGYRMHPIKKKRSFHNGVDLAVPIGTPLHSAQDGIVKKVHYDRKLSGKFVVIDHGHGVRTVYCHMDGFAVKEGDTVRKGEVFGWTGNTGPSTGPHVHFIVRINGKSVDPMRLKPPETPES